MEIALEYFDFAVVCPYMFFIDALLQRLFARMKTNSACDLWCRACYLSSSFKDKSSSGNSAVATAGARLSGVRAGTCKARPKQLLPLSFHAASECFGGIQKGAIVREKHGFRSKASTFG